MAGMDRDERRSVIRAMIDGDADMPPDAKRFVHAIADEMFGLADSAADISVFLERIAVAIERG